MARDASPGPPPSGRRCAAASAAASALVTAAAILAAGGGACADGAPGHGGALSGWTGQPQALPHAYGPAHGGAPERLPHPARVTWRPAPPPGVRLCSLNEPGGGGFWNYSEDNSRLRRDGIDDGDDISMPFPPWEWTPAPGCAPAVSSWNDVVGAFAGKTLTFVGDSTMRSLYFHLMCPMLRCLEAVPRAWRNPGCRPCFSQRWEIPRHEVRLGAQGGNVTLRFLWLSFMENLAGTGPRPPHNKSRWRAEEEPMKRRWDFGEEFGAASPSDFMLIGLGFWDIKHAVPGLSDGSLPPDVARTNFIEQFAAMSDVLLASPLARKLGPVRRLVIRTLPTLERGTPQHENLWGDGWLWHHYDRNASLALRAHQLRSPLCAALACYDTGPVTDYVPSAARTGVWPMQDQDGVRKPMDGQLTTDYIHPTHFVSMVMLQHILSHFATSPEPR